MMTIPSIDLMTSGTPPPIGELAARTLENGAAFASAVADFQRAMSETSSRLVTPETLKAAVLDNAALAAKLPEATPETLKAAVLDNAALAAKLPEATPETLKAAVLDNAALASKLPEATPETLKAVVDDTLALGALLPAVTKPVAPRSAPVVTEATPETLLKTIAENLAFVPRTTVVTVGTLERTISVNRALAPEAPAATARTLVQTVVVNQALAPQEPVATVETLMRTAAVNPAVTLETPVRTSAPQVAVTAPQVSVAAPEVPVNVLAADGRAAAPVVSEAAVPADGPAVAVRELPVREMPAGRPAVATASASATTSAASAPRRTATAAVTADAPQPEDVVLQAAPVTVAAVTPVEEQVAKDAVGAVGEVSADAVARISRATGAEVLVEAANAVVDTMMVSPGLMRGEGEIRIFLKPEVLSGTELRIAASGSSLTIEFLPTVERVAQLLVECQPQLVQHLAEKIHDFHIAVNVRRSGGRVDGKFKV